MSSMTVPSMTIGGSSARTGSTFPVVDPATGEVFAEAPACTVAQLDAAFDAAAAAQPAWAADEVGRCELLLRVNEAVAAAGDELVRLLVAESGKPTAMAELELEGADLWLRFYAGAEIERVVLHDDEHAKIEIRQRPLGVVAAITPWNFPVVQALVKIGAALRTGNTVVLKPSEFTPLASLRLGEILNDVLPAGVVN